MSRVTVDRATGALRIGGAKVFPLGLSNPPPLGGTAPNGADGLQEVAAGGASFIRTGRGDWGPDFQIVRIGSPPDSTADRFAALCRILIGLRM